MDLLTHPYLVVKIPDPVKISAFGRIRIWIPNTRIVLLCFIRFLKWYFSFLFHKRGKLKKFITKNKTTIFYNYV
jgi:hypothetical protein